MAWCADIMIDLAQNNFDWIENIFILVIIALGALSSVAQALIKKFSSKEKKEKKRATLEPRRADVNDEFQQGRPPVARPLPPRPRPAVDRPVADRRKGKRAEPIGLPEPLRDILSDLVPELVPERPREVVPEKQASQSAQPAPPPAVPTQERKTPRPKRKRVRRRAPAPEPVADEVTQMGQHLVNLDSELARPISDAIKHKTTVVDPFSLFKRPSRASLRYAIVMKEILGPPISLRQDSDYPS